VSRALKGVFLCFAATALVGAATINFDDKTITPGSPVEIATDPLASTYSAEGITFDPAFYFDNETFANPSSAPNFARVAGAENVAESITFSVPTHTVSLDTLGLSASANYYDGAVISFLSGGSTLNMITVQPVVNPAVDVLSQTVSFSSSSNITAVTISKFHNAGGPTGIFGFDNLAISASVPEPGSLALVGLGMLAAGLIRRRSAVR
jgi:hypothetical protein